MASKRNHPPRARNFQATLTGLITLSAALFACGCRQQPDQEVRDHFDRFYAAHASQLENQFDCLEISAADYSIGPSILTIAQGQISTIHTALSISRTTLQDATTINDWNDLNEFLASDPESFPIEFQLFRNNDYDFKINSDNSIGFVRTANGPEHVRPFLSQFMFPIAATSMGIPFSKITKLRTVAFEYFGESRSDDFPDAVELRLKLESQFDSKTRKGKFRYFFDESSGMCIGAITGSNGTSEVIYRCERIDSDTNMFRIENYLQDVKTGEKTLRNFALLSASKKVNTPNLDAAKLSSHNLPEPDLFRENSLPVWKYSIYASLLLGAGWFCFFILRSPVSPSSTL